MTELRKALERPVADLVFDENRKNAVREKAFTAKRGGSALRRGAAVALVCTVLCVTAVAAGPSLWQYMQARQGPFAGLAQTVEGLRYRCSAPWPTTCGERSTSRSAT